MDQVQQMQSMGMTMPSPAYLLGAIVFSVIGFAAFRYGKRSGQYRPLWLGIALMLYPYAVSATWLLYVVGAGLCAALYLLRG
jgi:hypothetical protein